MKKKAAGIVFTLTLLAFSNTLGNGFVGDDDALIVDNTFYKSWENFPRLFKPGYTIDSDSVFLRSSGDLGTGGVSFRPVTAATYFVDYSIWKLHSFGFHLTNLFIHAINGVLVFVLLLRLLDSIPPAFLGSLLFSLHPTKVGAVAAISYRSDSLATLFLLISFILFIDFRNRFERWRFWRYAGSILFFALALFSKESAVIFFPLLLAYDFHFFRRTIGPSWKTVYPGYLAILFGYLYLYFFAFTNSTLSAATHSGITFATNMTLILKIFAGYLIKDLLLLRPYDLPPLYSPVLIPGPSLEAMAGAALFLGTIIAIILTSRREKTLSFLLLWFLLSLIPVSNIIPLANPMAHRYLYLPSIGILAAGAIVFERWYTQDAGFSPSFKFWLKNILLGYLLIVTVQANSLWQNNFMLAQSWVKHFPNYWKGYTILGTEYFKAGLCAPAIIYLNRSLQLASSDPRIYFMLGACEWKDLALAEENFLKSIRMAPDYGDAHWGLGHLYFLHAEYEKAVPYLQEALRLAPDNYRVYKTLIQTSLALGYNSHAQEIYVEAQRQIKDPRLLKKISDLFEERPSDQPAPSPVSFDEKEP